MSSRRALIAFALPILALMLLSAHKAWVQREGVPVTFAITGFDPRDLLAGHYLIYRIDYGAFDPCADHLEDNPLFLCIDPRIFQFGEPEGMGCTLFLRGKCEQGRFQAGIEKFFIPEQQAGLLERAVWDRRGSLVVALSPTGQAVIRDLLIDGKSWRELK